MPKPFAKHSQFQFNNIYNKEIKQRVDSSLTLVKRFGYHYLIT